MDSDRESDGFELVEPAEVAKLMAAVEKPDIQKIVTWIKPTDYLASSSEFQRHASSKALDTGEWIRETPQFDQWHSSDNHGSIWIKAVPGAGKSVLAASMVESLSGKESVPVLFFFFRQIIESNRTSRALLGDWLCQLIHHSEIIQMAFWKHIQERESLENISTPQLWKYLLAALRDLPRVYCIVDALDEMDMDEEFLSQLNALGSFRPANVKVLMTSRPKQYLQKALKDPQVIHVSLEEELVKRDISIYVQQRAKEFETTGLDKETQSFIENTVCERSQGLFLYARLMLDQISQAISDTSRDDQSLRDIVAKLPVGLENMYNSMLRDHAELAKICQEVQILILQLVTQAARPMRLIEIAKAIETNAYISEDRRDSKDIVRSACGPLLEIMEDEVVQILHHSFTEFLLDNDRKDRGTSSAIQFPVIDPKIAHRDIASTCLAQLQGGAFDAYDIKQSSQNSYYVRSFDTSAAFLQYPFLEYAVMKWPYHAKQYDLKDLEFFQKLENFCQLENPSFVAWSTYSARIDEPFTNKVLCGIAPLFVAADHGLASWAEHLIANGADIEELDSSERSPIFWAARKGYPELVKLLLDAGAKPDLANFDGIKPLHVAASRNHWEVVKLLLNAGVSPLTPKIRDVGRRCGNASSTVGDHPLMYASRNGNLETVMEMVPYCKTEEVEGAIFLAASGGYHALVGALLEQTDVSPNAISSGHSGPGTYIGAQETLLMVATGSLEPQSVKTLLHKGADVYTATLPTPSYMLASGRKPPYAQPGGRTALHRLAMAATDQKLTAVKEILNMLLAAGADINTRDSLGNTPLLLTLTENTRDSEPAVLDLFLAAGSDPCAVNTDGDTLLHRACKTLVSTDITATLLRYKADPNQARHESGMTPLHLAVENKPCPDEHLKLLVEHGGDVNRKDAKGNTPLHIYTNDSQLHTNRVTDRALTTLLSLGADVNLQNDLDETCLHAIYITNGDTGRKVCVSNVCKIIDAGIDLELRNREGMTVLLHAVTKDRAFVQSLLEHERKPSINARTWVDGKTILHLACHTEKPRELIELLVNHGADLSWTDGYGNNLLHEVASGFIGHPEDILLVKYLINNGVDINSRNSAQQTAFHIMPVNTTASKRRRGTFFPQTLVGFVSQMGIAFDVNAKDCDGYTPLHYASAFSEFQTLKIIECGANVGAKSFNGRTPLHCAARGRRAGIVSMLLSYTGNGHDVGLDAQDNDGRTPLHDACRSGHPESVSILLAAGADFTKPDKNRSRPLEACVEAIEEQKIWAALDNENGDRFKSQDPFRISPIKKDQNDESRLYKKEFSNLRIGAIAKMLIAAGKPDMDIQLAYNMALKAKCPEMLAALKGEKSKESKVYEEARLMLSYYGASAVLEQATGFSPLQHIMQDLPGTDEPTMDALISRGFDFTEGRKRSEERTAIGKMTKLGLTELVDKIIDKAKMFDDPEFIKTLTKTNQWQWREVRPLLQIACDRPTWNMDMVRLLVEKGNVSVTSYHLVEEVISYSATGNIIPGTTALHNVSKGHYWWQIEAMRYLIERGADIHALNSVDETPLEIACAHSDQWQYERAHGNFRLRCAELLLQKGADPNRVNSHGLTPLNRARKDKEAIALLLKYGADVNRGTKGVLASAAEVGDAETLKFYLENGADCNMPDTSTDPTPRVSCPQLVENKYPIVIAALPPMTGEWSASVAAEMVELLLNHGANVHLPVRDGKPTLHYLFETATSTALRPLLKDSRIDMNIRDKEGKTAFMAACCSRVVSECLGNKTSPRYSEDLEDDYSHMYLLFVDWPVHGSKIDYLAIDNKGEHLIFYLISRQYDKMIHERILDIPGVHGLINKRDNNGYSPLNRALETSKISMVEQLVEEGADILQLDPRGNSFLHYLCRHRDLQYDTLQHRIPLMDKYLSLGGAIDARNDEGTTPLLAFITVGGTSRPLSDYDTHIEDFKWFAQHGADFTAKDNKGQSALHIIASRSNQELQRNGKKKQAHNAKLFQAFLEKGCEVLDEDNQGRTALDIAAVVGNKGILKLFQRTKDTSAVATTNSDDEEEEDEYPLRRIKMKLY
ncbi:ankyrin repeat domain protein [Rutstroemia sp. NJR-2017a WRK4]|nr:ankyrin repeat domain protein [Rutstroemia sp. NJR-2017a WRK4]